MLKLPEICIFKIRICIQTAARGNSQTADCISGPNFKCQIVKMATKIGDFASNFSRMQTFKWTKPVI